MNQLKVLFCILLACVFLSVNAQQSYRVVKDEVIFEDLPSYSLKDPIPNNIQGLVVKLTYENGGKSKVLGEELRFSFRQEKKWFTKPIVHRIAKDDGYENALLITWRNVDFYFEDKSIIHADCRLSATADLDIEREDYFRLDEDAFCIDIVGEKSPTLIKKMKKVKLKGIKVYDKKINFLKFNSIKALEALRTSAGTLSSKQQ